MRVIGFCGLRRCFLNCEEYRSYSVILIICDFKFGVGLSVLIFDEFLSDVEVVIIYILNS